MGMAASQARYLSLVARKSNVEYEGQQINQARTELSNQSANLFNQMLGLTVPTPPSTQDYTTTQYSYTDGGSTSVITSWQQLGTSDPDYNYVVTHYYTTNKFTGSLKKLSDPQVQYSSGTVTSQEELTKAIQAMNTTYQTYLTKTEAVTTAASNMATKSNYQTATIMDTKTDIYECTYDNTDGKDQYTVKCGSASATTETLVYQGYNVLSETEKAKVEKLVEDLNKTGAFGTVTKEDIYYNGTNIAFKSDLKNITDASETNKESLNTYDADKLKEESERLYNIYTNAVDEQTKAYKAYEDAVDNYAAMNHPTYVGNCELTPLAVLSDSQQADVNQIVKDMNEQGINCNITECFDDEGNYTGGIYTFQMNGQTYYTTLADLQNSYESGSIENPIDGQDKLTYYNAGYVETKVEKTEKALLETDGSGRFTSVKFEDDSVTYTLNMETTTDDNAYKDAMNQYYYDNAVYDKTIRDINAKTSIIQQEDQQLELKLKQLDTERNALTNEIDAVQKVVKDAVESGFKTFGG